MTAIDPSRCPLCGQANRCAMEAERLTGVEQPPCWCTQVHFGAEVMARIPAQALGQTCVCAACARAAHDTRLAGRAG